MRQGSEVIGIVKIKIFAGLITDFFFEDQPRSEWSLAPQLSGLSWKTLWDLDDGGEHKVETVFQLEMAMGFYTSSDERDYADEEIYCEPWNLAECTAIRYFEGERIFAIALPSSGLIKLIEEGAREITKTASNENDRSRHDAKGLRAFENYLYNHNAVNQARGDEQLDLDDRSSRCTASGLRTQFVFSIDEETGPLTKAQKKYVLELDECITALISRFRASEVGKAISLKAALQVDRGESLRQRFMETIAKLKRVNINVLAYKYLRETRVFDCTEYDPPDHELSLFGPESDYYLFSFHEPIIHIVIAPSNYLRLPIPIEPSLDWQPEPMWEAKVSKDGTHFDNVNELESSEPAVNPTAERDNIVALVPTPDAQSERND